MSYRNILIMIAALMFGFMLGILGKYTYENSTLQAYHWKSLPIIVNCYGPGFSEPAMLRAIDFWTLRGHNIGFYEHNPPESVCKDRSRWIYGMIVIRKATMFQLDPATLASTKRYTSMDQLKGAVIYYRPGSFRLDLLNEHELGHALGMTHVEKEGHIMHPLYEKMGTDFGTED